MNTFTIENEKLRSKLIKMGLLFDEDDYGFLEEKDKEFDNWIIASYKDSVRIMTDAIYDPKINKYVSCMLSEYLNVFKEEKKILELVKKMIKLHKKCKLEIEISKIEKDF